MARVLRASVGLAIPLLSTLLAACSGGGDRAVVTVNGQPITQSQFAAKVENLPKAHLELQRLVQHVLIDQYARQNNIVITDQEIDARERLYRSELPGAAWNKMLETRDLRPQDLRDFLRDGMILERVVAKNVEVTPADVRTFYDQHRAQFDKPGRKETLASAYPQILERLRAEQAFPWTEQFLDDLRKKSTIQVNDPRYLPLYATPPPIPPGTLETTPRP